MQILNAIIYAVKGDDPNDYKLLNQFFNQNPNLEQNCNLEQIPIQQLYQHLRENQDERITKILIQVLGYLSLPLAQAKMAVAQKLVQEANSRQVALREILTQAQQAQTKVQTTQTERRKAQVEFQKAQSELQKAQIELEKIQTGLQKVTQTAAIFENYLNKLKTIYDEFLATLTYSRETLVKDCTFSWLKTDQIHRYSWSRKHALDPTKQEEYLRRGLVLGVITWPMPTSLSYLLDLERIPYVKQCLASLNARFSQIIADIYKHLTPSQSGIYIPFQFTLPLQETNVNLQAEEQKLTVEEKALRREECLLKLAAFAGFPVLNSWIDEILAWGKKYGQMAKVNSIFKKFKLTHFIVDQTYLTTLSNSPRFNLRRETPVPLEYEGFEDVPLVEENTPSFQDYLIQKSLSYLQEEFSLSPCSYQALKKLFYSKEAERIHLLFVVYTIKALNQTAYDSNDSDYRLREMILESYYTIPHEPLSARIDKINEILHQLDFAQLFKIYDTLLKSVDSTTAYYAYAFLALFLLKHHFEIEIKPAQQALLVDYFAQLKLSAIKKTLAGLERLLSRFPFGSSYKPLSTLEKTDRAPKDFFRCLSWELYVRAHLPSICCKDLIELYSKLPLKQFKKVRLCIHQWLQLYPQSQKKLDLDELLILFEGTLPDTVVDYRFENSFSIGLTILNNQVSKTDVSYSPLHALLCFIYWHHYLNFSSKTQAVIFTAIQRTSIEHRECCIDSWLTFGRCLPINQTTPTIQAARELVLQEAYKAKFRTWNSEGLRQCLQQTPFPLEDLMDVQVQFLQRVEHLIQGPVPLITYLMLVWYCPFFPDEFNDQSSCLSKLMDDLQKLKISSNLKHFKNLFIHPTWIAQCDEAMKFHDSEYLMSAMYYFNHSQGRKGHVSNLINYIGPIKSALSSAVLPTLPFQENLCMQAEDLFKCAGKNFPTARQNRIYYYADATMNGNIHAGEWHNIGYMMEWKLSQSNSPQHPIFSIVLWQSFYHLQSREIRIPLKIPPSKLRPKLHPLLGKMLLTLGEDIADIQNSQDIAQLEQELNQLKTLKAKRKHLMPKEKARWDQLERKLNLQKFLDKLTTTQEELDFCLKFYNDKLTVDYEAALADSSLEKADLLSLFEFVKELKIQTRQAQADLLQHLPDRSAFSGYTLEWLAGQGNVYSTANGLSLIPPRFETPAFYRIENTEGVNELKDLVQRLQTTNEVFEISDLLNLPLSADVEERVSVSFTPYLGCDFEPDEEEIFSYLDQYQITIPSSPAPSRSQSQVLDKLVDSDLEDLKESIITASSLWLARHLYTQGWNVNQPLKNGTAPLVKAVQCRQPPIVLWLLLKGADPTLADAQGLTPLAVAQQMEEKGNQDLANARKRILIGTTEIYQVNGRKCHSLDEIKEARKELEESALSTQKMGQDLKKLLNGVNTIKEHFLRVNELTFKFKNHEGVMYSCKLMNFLHHANLEKFLRWHLLMLKSRYYAAEFSSTPNGNISTFLGIEERIAPPHLQTDYFENLDFKKLLLPTCEPLDQNGLPQHPPFKLQIIEARTLYEDSSIYEHLSIAVPNDPGYQQLKRFTPAKRPSLSLIGSAFVNNYPQVFRRSEVINCDMFYVEQDIGFIFSVLADGCGTGILPREAAQRAVASVVTYLHQSLNHPLDQLKTAQELACILVRSLAYAHDNILKEKEFASICGTTTINICFAFQKRLMTVGIGDSKAFLVHLHGDYKVEDVADRQHNNHDIRDPGGRLGPYGGNDHRSADHHPDLRNLSISCCPLPEKDYIVFNMSDGVHDNFDPEVLQKIPYTLDPSIEKSKKWEEYDELKTKNKELKQANKEIYHNQLKAKWKKEKNDCIKAMWEELKHNDLDKYQQLKITYQKQTLSRLVREAIEQGKQTPDEICEYITSYCHQVTEKKRKPMEEDSSAAEPYEPGKMDHCSIVAFKSQKVL